MKKYLSLILLAILIVAFIIPGNIDAAQIHRVEAGETLYLIAKKYQVTVEDLINSNNLDNPNSIVPNQEIVVPKEQEAKTTYQVVPGDTLYKIAQKIGITIADLASENKLINLDFLSIGQVLKLPAPQKSEPEATFHHTVSQLVKMYPETFFLKATGPSKKIAFTFDDGPNEIYTPQVLDILKEYDVPATFFIMGSRAEKHPHIVERMVREGHVIGNHTWSHPNLTKIKPEQLAKELKSTEAILKEITGLTTALFRPPYGAVSQEVIEQLASLEYKVINWSVDSIDWKYQEVDKILENTLPGIKGGDILLFHDAGGDGYSRAGTVEALPIIIENLKAQGYSFVTVDEILGLPAYK